MNNVTLVGRLTRDVESRSSGDMSVAHFTLAVDRRFKRDNDDSADFISCTAFGKTADFISKYFTKGMKLGLTGRIQTGSYTNRDGQKIYTTEVVAESVEFVERKGDGQGAPSQLPPGQTQQVPPPPAAQPQYNAPPAQQQIPPQYQQMPQQGYAQPQYQQQIPPQYQNPQYQQQVNQAIQANINVPVGIDEDVPFN